MSSEEHPLPARPSKPFITSNDRRSLLNILGWLLDVVIVIVVLTRLGTRRAKSRTISLDDLFIVLSTFFAIAQTICVSVGVSNGLGLATLDGVSQSQLDTQQKLTQAFIILFLVSQYLSKVSIILFIIALTPDRLHHKITYGILALCSIWLPVSILGFIFQCNLPRPWQIIDHKCFNRIAFYTFVEVFSIFLDTLLAGFPSIITYRLQLQTKTRAIVIAFFMSRLLVVSAAIYQLNFMYSRTASQEVFLSWQFVLLLLIIQSLSIITACGPYLKPFLESLNHGMMRNDDMRRRGQSTGANSHALGTVGSSKRSKQSGDVSTADNEIGSGSWARSLVSGGKRAEAKETDTTSQSSQSRIIRQTTTYMVRSDTE